LPGRWSAFHLTPSPAHGSESSHPQPRSFKVWTLSKDMAIICSSHKLAVLALTFVYIIPTCLGFLQQTYCSNQNTGTDHHAGKLPLAASLLSASHGLTNSRYIHLRISRELPNEMQGQLCLCHRAIKGMLVFQLRPIRPAEFGAMQRQLYRVPVRALWESCCRPLRLFTAR